MNEPSSPSAQSPTLSLKYLQEIIHNRIIQKKKEMHPLHNKAYLESLWTGIETLHWVSSQILTLLRHNNQPHKGLEAHFYFS